MNKIVIFILGCIIALPSFLIIAYYALPLSSPELQNYYIVKDHINATAPKTKKRLVIMTASDGMFGIIGKMIEKQTDFFPINYSMFFGMGIDLEFRIDKLISTLKDEDTLLLPLNYAFYTTKQNIQYFSYYQNMLAWGNKNFLKDHPKTTLQTLLKSPPSKLISSAITRIKNFYFQKNLIPLMQQIWNKKQKNYNGVHISSVDQYGEFNNHQGTMIDPSTTNPYIQDNFQITQYFLSHFKKLEKFCAEHHITIIVTYPPMLKNSTFNLDNPKDLEKINRVKKNLLKHNIHIIGNPKDFQYPIQDFYDSSNHLNTQGARKYTQELIKILNQSGL